MNAYEKYGVCPYDCPDSCGFIATTDGTSILSVKGDPNHPITRGFLCRKMHHYEEDIHSPHRITTPLKRVGAKGKKDSFVPISWDEAIREIGTKWRDIIKTHGADSILPYSYAGTMTLTAQLWTCILPSTGSRKFRTNDLLQCKRCRFY